MLNLMPRAVAIAVLLSAVATQAAPYSQDNAAVQAPSTQTLKVTTRIVVLDVVVTDKKGNLVPRELTRDDFTVLEDGQQQAIRSFEAPKDHRMPVSGEAIVNSAADLKKIGDAPVTILVLDELNSRFEDMSFSRQMMVKYLQAQPAVLKGYQASPPFKAVPGAVQFAAMRRDRREMHLQYLRPPRGRGGTESYDFLLIACGPQTLAERHALGKPASDLRG